MSAILVAAGILLKLRLKGCKQRIEAWSVSPGFLAICTRRRLYEKGTKYPY